MTRSWVFTIPSANVWVNLWTLISADSSFADPYFGNTAFIPSSVNELEIQSSNSLVNALNGGSVITIASDSKLEGGFELLSGSSDKRGTFISKSLSLKNINLKSTVAGVSVNVQITAN